MYATGAKNQTLYKHLMYRRRLENLEFADHLAVAESFKSLVTIARNPHIIHVRYSPLDHSGLEGQITNSDVLHLD